MKIELEIPDELARQLKQRGSGPLPEIISKAVAAWVSAHESNGASGVTSYERNGILVHHSGVPISPTGVERALAEQV